MQTISQRDFLCKILHKGISFVKSFTKRFALPAAIHLFFLTLPELCKVLYKGICFVTPLTKRFPMKSVSQTGCPLKRPSQRDFQCKILHKGIFFTRSFTKRNSSCSSARFRKKTKTKKTIATKGPLLRATLQSVSRKDFFCHVLHISISYAKCFTKGFLL